MRQEKIIEFEKKIGYTFENPYLLVTALTHSSYSNEKRLKKYKCNERLEFLGDAVLELISSEYIFKENPQKPDEPEGQIVKSPLVGTFYAAPSEDAEPFVSVGDSVKKGQTLAIVEAMKLMNEIESDFDGKVAEIYVENGQAVEYGQPLFRIV